MPACVVGYVGINSGRDETKVDRRDLAKTRNAVGVAPGAQLLEVSDLANVDLDRKVAANRVGERFVGTDSSTGKGPRTAVRLASALPEDHMQLRFAYLKHHCEGLMCRFGRLAWRFMTHRRKPSLDDGGMKMLRSVSRVAAAAMSVGLALAVAGCGGSDEGSDTTDTTATPTLRVGLVADAGQLNDNGFNELAFTGLKRAESELGIKGRVVEAKSAADYIPNMSTLARQGYDLVVAVGFAQGDAVAAAAAKFPDTKFAIVDVDHAFLKGKPANVQGLLFKEEQVGYLVGYLGALAAKRDGGNAISAVGGFKEPPVDRFIAGYQAGAGAAVPGIKVTWSYSQDWDDQAKCKELALNQIAAGSKVVFQVAGGCGLGALSAAKDKAVWGIGVDGDQSFLGPHVLTSALKGVDSAVFLTIQSVLDDAFDGGTNAIFGLDQAGVGLGTTSPDANADDIAAVEEIETKIAEGEIADIPTTVG